MAPARNQLCAAGASKASNTPPRKRLMGQQYLVSAGGPRDDHDLTDPGSLASRADDRRSRTAPEPMLTSREDAFWQRTPCRFAFSERSSVEIGSGSFGDFRRAPCLRSGLTRSHSATERSSVEIGSGSFGDFRRAPCLRSGLTRSHSAIVPQSQLVMLPSFPIQRLVCCKQLQKFLATIRRCYTFLTWTCHAQFRLGSDTIPGT